MALGNNEWQILSFCLSDEVVAIRQFLIRYQSVPMSIADACLVRMAELYSGYVVLTLLTRHDKTVH